jgi:hypothetical protein
MSIRNAGGDETLSTQEVEQGANFQGSIAANSGIAIELSWTPETPGNYTLLVFSATPEDLTSTLPIEPAAAIPITVK